MRVSKTQMNRGINDVYMVTSIQLMMVAGEYAVIHQDISSVPQLVVGTMLLTFDISLLASVSEHIEA